MKKRALCFLTAAVLVLLLPCASPADGCEHQFRPTEWILVGYVAPQPGVPGYSGDFCCPNCGAVMQKGQEIAAIEIEEPEPEPDVPAADPDPPAAADSPADVGSGEQGETPVTQQEPEQPVTQTVTQQEPEQPVTQTVAQQEPEQPVTQTATEQEPEQPVTQTATQQEPEQPVTQTATEQEPEQPVTQTATQQEPEQPVTQPVTQADPAQPEEPVQSETAVQPAEPQPETQAVESPPETPAEKEASPELPAVVPEKQTTDSAPASDAAPDTAADAASTANTGNPPVKTTSSRKIVSDQYPYRRVLMNPEPGIRAEAAGVPLQPAGSPLRQMLNK